MTGAKLAIKPKSLRISPLDISGRHALTSYRLLTGFHVVSPERSKVKGQRSSSKSPFALGPMDWCFRFSRDHDFRRFDDRHRLVTTPQLQLLNRVAGDNRSKRLVADAQPHLRQ